MPYSDEINKTLSKTMLVGVLDRNPEVRYLQDGTAMVSMTVKTFDTYKDKLYTDYHRVVAYGQIAENFATEDDPRADDIILVEGKNKTRSWESEDGKQRITEIRATKLTVMLYNQ